MFVHLEWDCLCSRWYSFFYNFLHVCCIVWSLFICLNFIFVKVIVDNPWNAIDYHLHSLTALWQKYFEIDDAFEESKREHLEKTDSLESIIRLFEVKMKNAQDHSEFIIPILDDIKLSKRSMTVMHIQRLFTPALGSSTIGCSIVLMLAVLWLYKFLWV